MSRPAKLILRCAVYAAVLLLLLECIGIHVSPIEVILYLIVGWLLFLTRVLPQVQVHWEQVLTTAVYALLLIGGSQFFLRWLYREISRHSGVPPAGAAPQWRLSWTLAAFMVLILMFVAGMAAIGIAHQTAWLITSREPIFRRNDRVVAQIRCASNLRQIGDTLRQWASDHDNHYPADLRELLMVYRDLPPQSLVCPATSSVNAASNQGPTTTASLRASPCSYIYFGKGLPYSSNTDRVIALDPLENHQDLGINVLYADGHVEWLDRPAAEKVMLGLGFRRAPIVQADSQPSN